VRDWLFFRPSNQTIARSVPVQAGADFLDGNQTKRSCHIQANFQTALQTCVGAPQSRIFEAEPVVSILTDYPRHNMWISTRRDLPLDGSAPAITSAL
jgi:hypothetical protein